MIVPDAPPIAIIGAVEVYEAGTELRWTGGLAIDGDGCPTCYAPPDSGLPALDYLSSAGRPGHWWGLITDADGEPVIQGADDIAPGYYVTQTALADPAWPVTSARRYVDASRVPYLAVPRELLKLGVHLGDVAWVGYRDQWSPAVVADVGPAGHLGEGSIALARALGINPSPKHGGTGAGVSVRLWRGSSKGWPRTLDDLTAQVRELAG